MWAEPEGYGSLVDVFQLKPKYVVICRAYQRYTLTERLSTRPFTVPIERLWYIYQVDTVEMGYARYCDKDAYGRNGLR